METSKRTKPGTKVNGTQKPEGSPPKRKVVGARTKGAELYQPSKKKPTKVEQEAAKAKLPELRVAAKAAERAMKTAEREFDERYPDPRNSRKRMTLKKETEESAWARRREEMEEFSAWAKRRDKEVVPMLRACGVAWTALDHAERIAGGLSEEEWQQKRFYETLIEREKDAARAEEDDNEDDEDEE
jgi:hypothetical protein